MSQAVMERLANRWNCSIQDVRVRIHRLLLAKGLVSSGEPSEPPSDLPDVAIYYMIGVTEDDRLALLDEDDQVILWLTPVTRTFWLSFCDSDLPTGQDFLGVCVVDVTEDDASEAAAWLREHRPQAREGSEWITAAMRKAWRLNCNPGGAVAFRDVTMMPTVGHYPRGRLLSRAEIDAIELTLERP